MRQQERAARRGHGLRASGPATSRPPSSSSAAALNREAALDREAARALALEQPRAFKPLYDALDEDAWLESKFEQSGAALPAEGDMTVVIEYCYNSGVDGQQLSTKHGEERYHEEAELVRQYFLNYYPGAVVHVIASDFRKRDVAPVGTRVRIGAFEIDARLRVDGRLVTFSLWSKLHTGRWPQWPDWQDGVREMVPVFELNLRPCALRSDGTAHFLPDAHVLVLNHDRSRVVVDDHVGSGGGGGGGFSGGGGGVGGGARSVSFAAAAGGGSSSAVARSPPSRGGGPSPGVGVRLLRGTYVVRVPMAAEGPFFAEETTLDLTRVPLPSQAHGRGPIDLPVPMASKPTLRLVVQVCVWHARTCTPCMCDVHPSCVLHAHPPARGAGPLCARRRPPAARVRRVALRRAADGDRPLGGPRGRGPLQRRCRGRERPHL